jgi:hypothetical protein
LAVCVHVVADLVFRVACVEALVDFELDFPEVPEQVVLFTSDLTLQKSLFQLPMVFLDPLVEVPVVSFSHGLKVSQPLLLGGRVVVLQHA